MRKLMWFTLGFGAACAGCAYLLPGGYMWAVGILFLLILAGAGILCRKYKEIASAALVFLGCAIGLFWWQGYDLLYLGVLREMDDTVQTAQIEISDYSYETKYGIASYGYSELEGKSYKVWVYLYEGESVGPGDIVQGNFRFRLTTPDNGDGLTYQSGNGVFLSATSSGAYQIHRAEKVPLRFYPALLRQKLLSLLDTAFPEDTAGFAKALLLGEDSGIDYETDTAFSVSGIRHIIAVSGLHVSILCSALYFITGRRRFLTSIAGISVLLLFAAVAGFTPSITRACIMSILMMLALLFRQEYDPPTALAFAALVMMLINPMVITSVSFQLSFGCMMGIFLFASPIRAWLLDEKRLGAAKGKGLKARMKRWFAGSVSVTLSAMSLTTPLSAYYFGTVSIVGVVTNLLGLWAVTCIFYGVILVCVAGSLWLPLGKLAAWGISWLIRYILSLSRFMASLPMAAVYCKSGYIVAWLLLCYLLFGIFLLMKKKSPAAFGAVVVIALCAALMCAWSHSWKENYRMTVLDVGQGQCILLQSEGRTFLVDCGSDYGNAAADTAAQTLLSQGICHLDGVILTHFDDDHAGGVQNLLTRIETDALLLPAYEENDLTAHTDACPITQNTVVRYGNTTITLFPAKSGASGNECSLCVLFQAENCDILITGDRTGTGEAQLMEQMSLPDLEVLVVGHHGSKTSTSEALLMATEPKAAVISVGADNSYGHPAQSVLDRLAEYGCQIYRTDLNGTIIMKG